MYLGRHSELVLGIATITTPPPPNAPGVPCVSIRSGTRGILHQG